MFLSTPDVPVTRSLKITMPATAWKQLDEMAKQFGTENVVEHAVSSYLLSALKKEKRHSKKEVNQGVV